MSTGHQNISINRLKKITVGGDGRKKGKKAEIQLDMKRKKGAERDK